MNELEPNDILRGRYRVKRTLAPPSGFGRTYLAEDIDRPGTPLCVIKQLRSDSQNQTFSENAKRLFYDEAVTLEELGKKHDRIPQLLAFFIEEENFYLIQDFIEGHPLNEELRVGYQWSEEQVHFLLCEVLEILKFVHGQGSRKVIHRDIKPDNIIRRDIDQRLVLVDFGAVKQILPPTAGQESRKLTVAVGTPGYMPAEQLNGMPLPSSDLYALGIIAIQALTGIDPDDLLKDSQTGEIIWQTSTNASVALKQILAKMVSYHFRDRYQSAEEVLQALSIVNQTRTPQALITGLHRLFTRQTAIFKPSQFSKHSNIRPDNWTALIPNTKISNTTQPYRATQPTEIAQSTSTQNSTVIVNSPANAPFADNGGDSVDTVEKSSVVEILPNIGNQVNRGIDHVVVESIDSTVEEITPDAVDITIDERTIAPVNVTDSSIANTVDLVNTNPIALIESVKESELLPSIPPAIEQPITPVAIAPSSTQIIEPPHLSTPANISAIEPDLINPSLPPPSTDASLVASPATSSGRSRLAIGLGGLLALVGVTVGVVYVFQQQQYRMSEQEVAAIATLKTLEDKVSSHLQEWADEMLAKATDLYRQGQFKEAIDLLKIVPKDTLTTEQAITLSNWEAEQQANQKHLGEARQALNNQKWQLALDKVNQIKILGVSVERNSNYWENTLEPIIAQAEQKLAEQRQREAEEQARQREAAARRNQPSGSGNFPRQNSGNGSPSSPNRVVPRRL